MFSNNINQILTLIKEAGIIDGRKKFQKIVFIIQSKGVDIQERFKYHYYGPFSSDLQLEIDDLVDSGILLEEYSENHYSYRMSPDITDFSIDEDVHARKDLIRYLNSIDTRVLELTSTIYFLQREGYNERNIIEKKLELLKPHLIPLLKESISVKEKIDEMSEESI